jgi:hypothetical protein
MYSVYNHQYQHEQHQQQHHKFVNSEGIPHKTSILIYNYNPTTNNLGVLSFTT